MTNYTRILSEAVKLSHARKRKSEGEVKAYNVKSGGRVLTKISKWDDGGWTSDSPYGHQETNPDNIDKSDSKKIKKISSPTRKAISRMVDHARLMVQAKADWPKDS